MANLFIGFPVPRAKIADMIEGAAPPLDHKTQHEKTGSDEMNVTGLVGAGGAAFPLRHFWLDDYFPDHARVTTSFTGSGQLDRSGSRVTLSTQNTNPSTARAYLRLRETIPTLTWEKTRNMILYAYLDMDERDTAILSILFGWLTTGNAMGFQVHGGKLWAMCKNSGGQTDIEITNYGSGWGDDELWLEVILFPGEKVEFWVNGALNCTSITDIPAGTNQEQYMWLLFVDNNSSTNNVSIQITNIQIYQEA